AFHRFIPLSTRSGQGLWLAAHKPELSDFSSAEFKAAAGRCRVTSDPKAADDCLRDDAKHMIAAHPGYYLKTSLGRIVRTLFGSHTEYLRGYSQSFSQAVR